MRWDVSCNVYWNGGFGKVRPDPGPAGVGTVQWTVLRAGRPRTLSRAVGAGLARNGGLAPTLRLAYFSIVSINQLSNGDGDTLQSHLILAIKFVSRLVLNVKAIEIDVDFTSFKRL